MDLGIERRLNASANSGATLALFTDEVTGELMLRKTFHSDFNRAEQAVLLQSQFRLIGSRTKAIPIQWDETQVPGELRVRMPFCHGVTGAQFAMQGTREVGLSVRDRLDEMLLPKVLGGAATVGRPQILSKINVVMKLESVLEAAKREHLPTAVLLLVEKSLRKVDSLLPNSMADLEGPCHGDLTLSNVILSSKGTLFLFDFLPVWWESPLQDVAKLIQDFKFGWSFRNEAPALKLKGAIFCREFQPRTLEVATGRWPEATWTLSMLTLARIVPYIKDETTYSWVVSNLNRILNVDKVRTSWLSDI